MSRSEMPPHERSRREEIERLVEVAALLIMALAALVAALHGGGPA
jgi:hypothetical protein